MGFSEQLKAFQGKTERKLVVAIHSTVLDLSEVLIEQSPWGDWQAWAESSRKKKPMPPYRPGRFKGSWGYGYESPPIAIEEAVDPSGQASMMRIEEAMGPMGGWSLSHAAAKHYLANYMRYSTAMEDGFNLVGHNLQLGHMLSLARQDYPHIVRQNARTVVP